MGSFKYTTRPVKTTALKDVTVIKLISKEENPPEEESDSGFEEGVGGKTFL